MCAGGPNGPTPWQDDEQSVPPAHRRADERVAATYARPWDEPNVARLVGWQDPEPRPEGDDHEAVGRHVEAVRTRLLRRICSVMARARVVARLREAGRQPIVAIVVHGRDGTHVIFDAGGTSLTLYGAPDVESATTAARAILASGSAYNW